MITESKSNNKFLLSILILLIVVLLGVSAFTFLGSDDKEDTKVDITVSSYPLYSMMQDLFGDTLNVEALATSHAHDYEPTPKDVADVAESELFVYFGNDFDEWAGDIETDTQILNISQELNAENVHLWLSPRYAQNIVTLLTETINDTFGDDKVDSVEFIDTLEELDEFYTHSLSECNQETVVIGHNAFEQVEEDYGIDFYEINSNEEGEPTTGDIRSGIEKIEELDTLFVVGGHGQRHDDHDHDDEDNHNDDHEDDHNDKDKAKKLEKVDNDGHEDDHDEDSGDHSEEGVDLMLEDVELLEGLDVEPYIQAIAQETNTGILSLDNQESGLSNLSYLQALNENILVISTALDCE